VIGGDLEVHLVVLDRLLRVTTKMVVNFLRKKVHPRDKILPTPMHPLWGQEQVWAPSLLKGDNMGI